jgi:hypothetical protein
LYASWLELTASQSWPFADYHTLAQYKQRVLAMGRSPCMFCFAHELLTQVVFRLSRLVLACFSALFFAGPNKSLIMKQFVDFDVSKAERSKETANPAVTAINVLLASCVHCYNLHIADSHR